MVVRGVNASVLDNKLERHQWHYNNISSHSKTTLTIFQIRSLGSSVPVSLPIPHHPTPAANSYYKESLVSYDEHQPKPKVAQVNKTATSAALPQFMVRLLCTSTTLKGQLLQLEPTAKMQGHNSNAMAGPVSAPRHSHRIN